jgi:hypothetical protein
MKNYIIFLLLTISCAVNAQVFQRTTEDAGAIGLGSATVAFSGLEYGIQNEAQLGASKKYGFLAGTAVPFSIVGWSVAHVQAHVGIGKIGGIGVDFASSGIDAYKEQRIRLMYGRKLSPVFSLGGGFDFLTVNAQDYGKSRTFTFGLALLAQPMKQLSLGFRLSNPVEAKINEQKLPTVIKLGGTYEFSKLFKLLFETEKDIDRPALIKAGLEYKPQGRIVIRAGVRNGRNLPARLGLGVGLRLKSGLAVDFGSEWHTQLGITPALTVLWNK